MSVERQGGEEPADLAVVTEFYKALERGDGQAASQKIIPHKQAKGPFSAQALTSYYGSLDEPLRLVSVESLGSLAVRARYQYRKGSSRCNGEAVVSLSQTEEGLKVEKIRALSGC